LPGLDDTLARLNALGVPNVAFYALASPEDGDGSALPGAALADVAAGVERAADEAVVRYQWQPPVERDAALPLQAQLRAGPRASSDLAVRIEPDGSVVPPRGPYQVAGNILRDNWQTIWRSDAFRRYRERIKQPTRCATCPGLAICAADCPMEPLGWSSGA
jgi:radical SAM protein with 4Fe4S-binding SPASM domain